MYTTQQNFYHFWDVELGCFHCWLIIWLRTSLCNRKIQSSERHIENPDQISTLQLFSTTNTTLFFLDFVIMNKFENKVFIFFYFICVCLSEDSICIPVWSQINIILISRTFPRSINKLYSFKDVLIWFMWDWSETFRSLHAGKGTYEHRNYSSESSFVGSSTYLLY